MQTSLRSMREQVKQLHAAVGPGAGQPSHAPGCTAQTEGPPRSRVTLALYIQSTRLQAATGLRLYSFHPVPASTSGSWCLRAVLSVHRVPGCRAQKSRCASSARRATTWSYGKPGQLVGRAARRHPEPRATKADADQPAARMQVIECSWLYWHVSLSLCSTDQLLMKYSEAQAVPRRPIGAKQCLGALGR